MLNSRNFPFGFSVLETVIASFIFLTVIVGVMGIWNTHERGIAKARGMLIANELGERLMEKCLAARYEKVPLLHGTSETIDVDFLIQGKRTSDRFTGTVTVEEGDFMHYVIVKVEWKEATGPRDIELHSVLHSRV